MGKKSSLLAVDRPKIVALNEDRFSSSCRKLCANLVNQGRYISANTVLRCPSKAFGLKSCKPVAKPRLTSAINKKILSYTNIQLDRTVEKWEKVLFLTVQQLAVRKKYIRRLKCQRFNAKWTVGKAKHPQAK